MSAEAPVAQDVVRRAAARVKRLLYARPDDDAADIIDEFVAACSALPPGQSATDLVSALRKSNRVLLRRLEAAALPHFQRQLQQRRPRSGGGNKVPRAWAELQTAAKAWAVSPLVLLAEFHHGPTSDNFWRLLSRLARSSRHGCWPTARKRLHAARRRRCHGLLVRRQGVSRVQPWAIPDIVAVLQGEEQGEEQEQGQGQGQGQGQEQEQEQEHVAPRRQAEIAQPTQTDVLDDEDDDEDDAMRSSPGTERMSSWLSSAALEASGEDSNTAGHALIRDVGDTEKTSIWRLAYGWWLPSGMVGRLCTSLAQIQPDFAVLGVGIPPAVDTRRRPPDATTLVLPFLRKTPHHWALATVCVPEQVVSLYDPLSSHEGRPLQVDADMVAALESRFRTLRLGEGTPLDISGSAIVVRSCPTQTNSTDSGVAVVALSLYGIVGRAIPQTMDYWLWRRMLAFYLAPQPSDDAAQAARNAAMAAVFAANHTALYDPTSTTRTVGHRSTVALRDAAVEGRAVWMAAARLASKVEAAEADSAAIAGVADGIRAVLCDLDALLAVL